MFPFRPEKHIFALGCHKLAPFPFHDISLPKMQMLFLGLQNLGLPTKVAQNPVFKEEERKAAN